MGTLIYKEESFLIIGKCMEVHNHLGGGFSEIVYKDALELELTRANIPFEREKNMISNIKMSYYHIVFMQILS